MQDSTQEINFLVKAIRDTVYGKTPDNVKEALEYNLKILGIKAVLTEHPIQKYYDIEIYDVGSNYGFRCNYRRFWFFRAWWDVRII